ncbi:GNAT family N-acetyltransferase [Leisingera sp. ANG-Vp]|uniref:GNAT family N-acetyltransferase n=1 Tax=Leisingera sp. ANG-Vp TaxID=1577896 RepID=UPI0009E2A33E|nr:GNAT family N-acetyltransferase [Leisingera sp. ANG-Vp]
MKRVLRLEISGSLEELEALDRQLEMLAHSCTAGAFDRPGFFLPWARAAVADGQRPACLCLYRGSELTGFLPVFFHCDRKALMAQRGRFPEFGSSPAFDLLLAPSEDEEETCALLVQALDQQNWLDLTFANLPEDSRLAQCLPLACQRQGFQVNSLPGLSYHMIDGLNDSATFLAQMKGRNRRNWKRKERHLRETCDIHHFTHETDYVSCLPMLRDVLENSWKFDDRMRGIGLPLYENQVLGTARDGTLGIWFACLKEKPLAFAFELADPRGGHHGYFMAYNAEYARFGAGGALAFMAILKSLDSGNPRYDLWSTRGHMSQLANCARATTVLEVRRRGALPRLRLAAAEQIRAVRHALQTVNPRPQA